MNKLLKSIGVFFLDTIETIVVSLAIFVVIYLFLFQPHQVKGASMEPNFSSGEFILTDKITYRFRNPQRYEVIIFKAPPDPNHDFIKRIIALPGEKVKILKGKIYINDKVIKEPYLDPRVKTSGGSFLEEGKEIYVPEDHFLVLGDNRDASSDSRSWGTVTRDAIIGRAFFRYWPPKKIGFINSNYDKKVEVKK